MSQSAVEDPGGVTTYIARRYEPPTGATAPTAGGSATIEPWHAVRVVDRTAERKPVCLQGTGVLATPYSDWDDAIIAPSRCEECVTRVNAERTVTPDAQPEDWMYYVEGATLADLRFETRPDGSKTWFLWYRSDPREATEGEAASPVRREVVPPIPLGLHDEGGLVAEVELALGRRYGVTREHHDSPDVVAAWRLGPL